MQFRGILIKSLLGVLDSACWQNMKFSFSILHAINVNICVLVFCKFIFNFYIFVLIFVIYESNHFLYEVIICICMCLYIFVCIIIYNFMYEIYKILIYTCLWCVYIHVYINMHFNFPMSPFHVFLKPHWNLTEYVRHTEITIDIIMTEYYLVNG